MAAVDHLTALAHQRAPVSLMRPAGRPVLCRIAGLSPAQADKLAAAPRIQGRLTDWLTRQRGLPDSPTPADAALVADAEILDRAKLFAGAAIAAPALSQIVTREARSALAAWLPEEALRFSLRHRNRPPPWRWSAATRSTVMADGRACAYAWTETLEPGDLLRLSFRWTLPNPREAVFESRHAPDAAQIFQAAVTALSEGGEG